MVQYIQSVGHCPKTTCINDETFLQDSEAFASELLKNTEETFPQFYMHRDIFSKISKNKLRERVNRFHTDISLMYL